MAGWHHRLDGHEFDWTLGVGDGQGGLVCCNSWSRKESDTTERLNWTELNCTTQLVPAPTFPYILVPTPSITSFSCQPPPFLTKVSYPLSPFLSLSPPHKFHCLYFGSDHHHLSYKLLKDCHCNILIIIAAMKQELCLPFFARHHHMVSGQPRQVALYVLFMAVIVKSGALSNTQ